MKKISMRQILIFSLATILIGSLLKYEDLVSFESWTALATENDQRVAKLSADWHVPINPLVERRLVKTLSEEGRREDVKDRLAAKKNFRAMIKRQLQKRQLPLDLLAIPFVETGFLNVGQTGQEKNVKVPGAGIWMLVENTGRAYGLQIDGDKDERYDPKKSTSAALDLLEDYAERFGSIKLAIAAYNEGPTRIQKAISRYPNKSPYELIEAKAIGNYLVKVSTAAVIMAHPEIIEEAEEGTAPKQIIESLKAERSPSGATQTNLR